MSARRGRILRWALLTVAMPALAQPALPISVERHVGAESCPDTEQLAARIAALRGESSASEPRRYRIGFVKNERGFSATIESDAEAAAPRQLSATEPDCEGLARATAVTLAMLLDADLAVASEPPKVIPVAPPPAPAPARPRSPSVRLRPVASLGVSALVGVLQAWTPAVVIDAGIEARHFRVSAGLLWAPAQDEALSPGSVKTRLVSGNLRLCYGFLAGTSFRFDGCSGALIGAATAEAQGFTINERQRQLFLAFPAELAVSGRSGFAGFELSAAGLLLTPPNEFVVEGVGAAYRPRSLALMLTLRAQLLFMR